MVMGMIVNGAWTHGDARVQYCPESGDAEIWGRGKSLESGQPRKKFFRGIR